MNRRRRLRFVPLAILIAVAMLAPVWVPSMGTFLVREDPAPTKADAVIVLAGDSYGLRIQKGGDLVREGFAPYALVSGPNHFYGKSEADLAIDWIKTKGYPESFFVPVPVSAMSTEEEAKEIAEEVHKRGLRHVLLVTSNYHTRRAGHLWRKALNPTVTLTVIGADDRDVRDPAHWWDTREGRKKIFFEWVKTVTGPLGW